MPAAFFNMVCDASITSANHKNESNAASDDEGNDQNNYAERLFQETTIQPVTQEYR